jgi:hypothetical protein
MLMITIHCSSTIHQKSVVHPPYNKFMILMDHSWLHIEQPRKLEMLFDQVRGGHFILDEAFDVVEQTILVLVQIVEQMGHFNQRMTLGNLMGLTGLSSSLLPDSKTYWPSSSSLSSLAASFSAASFLRKLSSLLFKASLCLE